MGQPLTRTKKTMRHMSPLTREIQALQNDLVLITKMDAEAEHRSRPVIAGHLFGDTKEYLRQQDEVFASMVIKR